jgi:hypothetical protein
MGTQERGTLQKDQAQWARLYGDMVIANRCTVFLIAQIQANTSGYGAPTQMKVGNALKHQADCILFFKDAQKWKGSSTDDAKKPPLGHDITVECVESALGPPHVEFKIPLRFGEGIDTLKDLIDNAVNWDIIKLAGAWYNIPMKEDKGGKLKHTEDSEEYTKLQGENKVRQWFSIRPEAVKILEELLRKMIFGGD